MSYRDLCGAILMIMKFRIQLYIKDFCQKRNGFTYNIPTMVDYYLPILVYYGLDMIIVILLAIFKVIRIILNILAYQGIHLNA